MSCYTRFAAVGRGVVFALIAWLSASGASAVELPGVLLHAADFVGNATLLDDETALEGQALRGSRWYYFCREVPFPQGDGAYHVYVRLKSEGVENRIGLVRIGDDNKPEVLATVALPKPGAWTWVKFAPVEAKTVGPRFALHCTGQDKSQWILLDGIVISREPELSAATLDEAFRAMPSTAGLLVAPRTATPPTIDGKLDDACYQSAVAAFPFVELGRPRFVPAQTQVWAAWDADRLYLAARMNEPILDPAANRRGDFQQQVAEHDGPVWTDDCLEVFLDPACQGREYYQLAVNALGTIYDARGRDQKFESGAAAAARVDDGSWSVELAVPLESLGIAASDQGRVLGANFARERKHDGEISSWSPLTQLAEPAQFGRIALVDAPQAGPAGLALQSWDLFRFGENRLSFAATGRGSVTAYVHASTERGRPIGASAAGTVGQGQPPLDAKYTTANSGRSTVQFVLIDNASGQPAHRSPVYHGDVAGEIAEIDLKSDGRLELRVNGESVDVQGPDNTLSANAPLIDGLSTLAVQTSGTTLEGCVRVGAHDVPVDSSWRWVTRPSDHSAAVETDATSKVTADGSGIRAPAAGGVFLKSIAVNATRHWPNYDPELHLAQGAAQWFHLKLKGVRGLSRVNQPVVVVDVPEGIELVDGAGFYAATRTEQPRFTRTDRGPIVRDGASYRQIAFRADQPIRTKEQVNVLSLFSATIRTQADGSLRPGDACRLYYHLEGDDGALVEIPRPLALRIVEPLDGKQPKQIVVQCWPGWLKAYDGRWGMEAMVDTIARAGFNDVGYLADAAMNAAMRHRGIRTHATINFQPWSVDLAPYLKAHADDALLDAAGKRSETHLCTTRLVGSAWDEFVDAAIAAWLDRHGPDHVIWDHESSAFTGRMACYCDRCLAAFRQWAKLPADAPLTPQSIQQEHRQAWIDFMVERSGQAAQRFRESLKKHRPAVVFSMYSGYQSPITKEIYSVDWALCAPHLDLVSCGYGRRVEEVAATREAAGDTPCVFGSLTYPYNFNDDSAATAISAAEVLRRLCDARGGVLFYDLNNADARTLGAFAKVSRVAAECEEFFLRGTEDRTGFEFVRGNASDAYVFASGPRRLVCLVNESSAPAPFEIQCPAPVENVLTKTTAEPSLLQITVAPGDIAVFSVQIQGKP